ncbi:hypothetical protein MBLNU230_g0969t1 [Neophaeotheca triangularis]
MDAFVSRKRPRVSPEPAASLLKPSPTTSRTVSVDEHEESTEFKLALLASTCPDRTYEHHVLLDCLLASDGSVEEASKTLSEQHRLALASPPRKPSSTGRQSSMAAYVAQPGDSKGRCLKPAKKGKTLHLFSAQDIEHSTPCSIVHNFLPAPEANELLRELLQEAPTFHRQTFQLFDRTVQSPHSMAFFVDTILDVEKQKTEYVYNGSTIADVRQTAPEMLKVSQRVQKTVNEEIERRCREFYPGGKKLKFQSPDPFRTNASFVNCYDGGTESVGYHSDQLTYLGPRAVIGSLSLGVAREFRVRRIVPSDEPASADAQGQIAIHLPHNSLLIMHAEMQEEWKHAVAPAQTIDPHPIAGNKRLNITYRCYQDYLHPKYTPRCNCNVPTVLRCVQKKRATRGRYVWMCHSHYTPGSKGCEYFSWAEFDEDGRPPWTEGYKGNANVPSTEQPNHFGEQSRSS